MRDGRMRPRRFTRRESEGFSAHYRPSRESMEVAQALPTPKVLARENVRSSQAGYLTFCDGIGSDQDSIPLHHRFQFDQSAAIRLDGCMRLFCGFLTLSLCLLISGPAQAGKRGKRHREGDPPTPTPTPALVAIVNPADPPSENLTRSMQAHLADLSDIRAAGAPASVAYHTDVSLLRAAFQSQATAAAPKL